MVLVAETLLKWKTPQDGNNSKLSFKIIIVLYIVKDLQFYSSLNAHNKAIVIFLFFKLIFLILHCGGLLEPAWVIPGTSCQFMHKRVLNMNIYIEDNDEYI